MIALKYSILSVIWLLGLFYTFVLSKKNQKYHKIVLPIFFITLGVLLNTVEILLTGMINDFIDLKKIGISWPIFNVADIFITVGLGWLIFNFLRFGRPL